MNWPSPAGLQDFDQVLSSALADAADALVTSARKVGVGKIGERKFMQPALLAALRERLGDDVAPREPRLVFKHLQGPAEVKLGGVDIAVRREDNAGWRAFMELKWGDLDWAILDFFKMTVGRNAPGADACYVIAGEPAKIWEGTNPVGALFRTATRPSPSILNSCRNQFIGDGREHGKLTRLPPEIATVLVYDDPLVEPLDAWRIKAIRVEPLPLSDDTWLSVADATINR